MITLPFAKLPKQAPINPRADAYGEAAVRLSQLAAMTTRCSLDIPYGPGAAQRLDIYMPEGKAKDLPVFINIHGGGWMAGYKEWMGLNAPAIVAAPAIYVSIEYALTPTGARHPTQINDCVAALAWVYANIAHYGGDPARIFVGGHSAGGHLSALLTLRRDLIERAKLPHDVIKACFPYSGVYDMRDLVVYGEAGPGPATALVTTPEEARDASPICWVKGNETPFFVTWGENDNVLIHAEAPAFLIALRDQPGRAEGHMFPLFDHFWMHISQQDPASLWTRTLLAWMNGDPRTAPVAKA